MKLSKGGLRFLETVSALAIMLGATGAMAQDLTLDATNDGAVSNLGAKETGLGNLSGVGSSVSVSAIGARASLSNTAVSKTGDTDTRGLTLVALPGVEATATNDEGGTVDVTDAELQFAPDVDLSGSASSVSASATGAASSVNASAVATPDVELGSAGTIDQTATNRDDVGATAQIVSTTPAQPQARGGDPVAPDMSGSAASMSVSATGASTSLGVSLIESDNFAPGTGAQIGPVAQESTLEPNSTADPEVSVNTVMRAGDLSGTGASASASAVGARAGVSVSVIESDGFTGITIADGGASPAIDQVVSADGKVTVSQGTQLSGSLPLVVGELAGDASAAQHSTAGASASVSEAAIGSTVAQGSTIGDIEQSATLEGGFGTVSARRGAVVAGALSGDAASARSSVLGAGAGVSSMAVDSEVTAGSVFGDVTQTSEANRNTFLRAGGDQDPIVEVDAISGDGAAAVASVTNAAASVSASGINASASSAGPTFGDIDQTVTGNNRAIAEGAFVKADGAISGDGSAAAISANGASGSVSSTTIGPRHSGDTTFGDVTLNVTQDGSLVRIGNSVSGIDSGELSGKAASASVSASGAAASVSDTLIGASAAGRTVVGAIDLDAAASDTPDVIVGQANGGTPSDVTVDTGALSGAAASARIGATGASAGVSFMRLGSSGGALQVDGAIDIDVTSTASVTNENGAVTTGAVSGNGASAGLSATGAGMSVSATSIDGTVGSSLDVQGGIAQDGSNSGAVTLSDGTVTAGGLSGVSASVSASAAGISASVSATGIRSDATGDDGQQYGLETTSPITQGISTTPVTNSGAISVSDVTVTPGALSGTASSAGISARGASGSVSLAAIQTNGTNAVSALQVSQIQQFITNEAAGEVSITDSSIVSPSLSGTGASASISGVGASAAVNLSTIAAANLVTATLTGGIDQTVNNSAPVTVTDASITSTGNVTGNGASASISAVGASASVAATTIN